MSNPDGTGIPMSGEGENSPLSTALRKLTEHGFDPVALPQSETSGLWARIERECELSLAQVSALQNQACTVRPRGVLERVGGDGVLYKINDERVRAVFTISNEGSSRRYTFEAELLVDSGSNTELKLPARKVLQLGLTPVGTLSRSRGSTNDTCWVKHFSPVLVKAKFSRNGVEETVENYLLVKCDKKEYDELVAQPASVWSGNRGGDPFATPVVQEPGERPGSDSDRITEIRLTPNRHRPLDAPLQQAVIGID